MCLIFIFAFSKIIGNAICCLFISRHLLQAINLNLYLNGIAKLYEKTEGLMGFLALLQHLADNKPAVIQSESDFTRESKDLLKNLENSPNTVRISGNISGVQRLLAI